MSGIKFLLDTNIILYLLQGDKILADILQEKHIYISFITEIELYSFKQLTPDEKSRITQMVSSFTVVDINTEIKSYTIDIRRTYNLKIPDSLIAGTALHLDMPLLSADDDFTKIDSLFLVRYEK